MMDSAARSSPGLTLRERKLINEWMAPPAALQRSEPEVTEVAYVNL